MKRILNSFLLLVLVMSAKTSSAQTAIHGSFLHYESIMPRGTFNLVLGVDRDVSPKSGFAIDFNAGYGGSNVFRSLNIFNFSDDYSYEGFEEAGYDSGSRKILRYKSTLSSFGLTYRSYFFVSKRQNGGFYLGPFIGFRYLRQKAITESYEPYDSFSDYYNWRSYSTPKWNNVVVPLGLRIGLRTPIPGFLGDLFFGVGYQAGSAASKEAPYLTKKDQLSPLFMQFGFSMGGGWGGKK